MVNYYILFDHFERYRRGQVWTSNEYEDDDIDGLGPWALEPIRLSRSEPHIYCRTWIGGISKFRLYPFHDGRTTCFYYTLPDGVDFLLARLGSVPPSADWVPVSEDLANLALKLSVHEPIFERVWLNWVLKGADSRG